MRRRDFFKGLLAAPAMPALGASQYNNRLKGLPPLTIKDVKVIMTNGGRGYRWVFLKIITSEAGLYGIGSANDSFQTYAVAAALEKHLKARWTGQQQGDRRHGRGALGHKGQTRGHAGLRDARGPRARRRGLL